MQVLRIHFNNPDPKVLQKAAAVLRREGVIIYPADTAGYSIGASALNRKAIRKVFLLKRRLSGKPLNIVVDCPDMAKRFVHWSKAANLLAAKFLPGPLALILPKKGVIPGIVTAGKKTLGIRIPTSPAALAIAKTAELPFTVTTANISGTVVSSYSLDEIFSQFGEENDLIDLILDAGKLPRIPPSTVLDLTLTPPKILRAGPVSKEKLEKVLGQKVNL